MKNIGFCVSKVYLNILIYTKPPLIVIVATYVDNCLKICNDRRQFTQEYKNDEVLNLK